MLINQIESQEELSLIRIISVQYRRTDKEGIWG